MDANTSRRTGAEVCKALDALATLSVDIGCHADLAYDEKVLTGRRADEICAAIHESIAALERILRITAHDAGIVPQDVLHRVDELDR